MCVYIYKYISKIIETYDKGTKYGNKLKRKTSVMCVSANQWDVFSS